MNKVTQKRNVELNINGQTIKAKFFVTRKAAENYISRNPNTSIIFFSSHSYYVA